MERVFAVISNRICIRPVVLAVTAVVRVSSFVLTVLALMVARMIVFPDGISIRDSTFLLGNVWKIVVEIQASHNHNYDANENPGCTQFPAMWRQFL